ncbi:MAG: hypothetical protein AAF108_11130 [Planctomycetota bacterium]
MMVGLKNGAAALLGACAVGTAAEAQTVQIQSFLEAGRPLAVTEWFRVNPEDQALFLENTFDPPAALLATNWIEITNRSTSEYILSGAVYEVSDSDSSSPEFSNAAALPDITFDAGESVIILAVDPYILEDLEDLEDQG